MSTILCLASQDFKLLLRNAIFWVLSVTLILVIILVNFVIPKELSVNGGDLIVYGIEQAMPGAIVAQSPEDVQRLAIEKGSLGIIKNQTGFTIISDSLDQKGAAAIIAMLTQNRGAVEIQIENLRDKSQSPPINLSQMPTFICFEAIVLGFLMAAILMLGEKQDNVLAAYRISPGGPLNYILGKVFLFSVLGGVYALLMTITTVGFGFNFLDFIFLTIIGCSLYTLLGLCVAVFFKDISGWFLVAVLILSVNLLPVISYFLPTFSPSWIRYIPSYSLVFAYGEILFGGGKSLWSTYGLFLVQLLGVFILCFALVKHKLLKAN